MSYSNERTVADELRLELDRMLEILRGLAGGAVGLRATSSFDEGHPVGALAAAFNDVAAALETKRAERQGYERELEERIELIGRQRTAIAELSTPVIEIWPGILTLPVLGIVDSERADRMMRELLAAVSSRDVSLVVIDVTGLDVVDTRVADHFIRMARSVRLLGSEAALSGLRPNVASTLVAMGVEVSELRCHPTLRSALAEAIGRGTRGGETNSRKPNGSRGGR